MSDSLITRYITIEADRGNIYTEDGKLLATSLPVFEVRMDMMAQGLTNELFNDNVRQLADELSRLFGNKTSYEYYMELTQARKNKERYHLIKNNVSYVDLQQLKQFPIFRLGRNTGGLIVKQYNKRIYPYNILAKRTIGYVRDNNIQPVGLEAYNNDLLKGIPGKQLVQKAGNGIWLPLNDEQEVEPVHGKDIYTTLDVGIQDLAEHALLKTLLKNKADHGCVIVMEVQTGKIKAIANLGRINDSTYAELMNYAVGEALEPGSTFKLASMLALFEDGYISPNHMVDVELGRKMFFNQMMKDAEDHNFREITVKQLFAHSSNVGVSKLVYQYYSKNPDQFLAHLRRLQLDQLTGIEVPGEKKPRIKNTKDADWSKVSLPWMSVGYELNITPLRLLTLYNAVANDGKMMKPYLIESVREYNKIIKQHQPEVLVNQIAKPQTIQYLKEILEAVVIEGTAKNLYNNYYSIAGKTGTAQIATDNSGYGNKIYQSSFMGYFPADKPLYSIAVVVNNPKLAYYGSVVAAPVFKEIADNIYASQSDLMMHTSSASGAKLFNLYSGTQEDIIEVCNTLHVPIQNLSTGIWVSPVINDSTITIRDINFSDDKIPSVVGMGLRDALYLLESKGIQVKFSGFGKVKAQSLPAGTAILQDQTITLTLGL
jgi:cell division protein FtsI (penicillin-binding protein 3)